MTLPRGRTTTVAKSFVVVLLTAQLSLIERRRKLKKLLFFFYQLTICVLKTHYKVIGIKNKFLHPREIVV